MCSVGDWVDCNYRDRGNWYPGKISAFTSEGLYNVSFDDGDHETGVAEERISYVGPAMDEGARCEIDSSKDGTGEFITGTFHRITREGLAEVS